MTYSKQIELEAIESALAVHPFGSALTRTEMNEERRSRIIVANTLILLPPPILKLVEEVLVSMGAIIMTFKKSFVTGFWPVTHEGEENRRARS